MRKKVTCDIHPYLFILLKNISSSSIKFLRVFVFIDVLTLTRRESKKNMGKGGVRHTGLWSIGR